MFIFEESDELIRLIMVGGIYGFKFSSPTSRNRIYQPVICGKGNMQPQFLLEFLEGKKRCHQHEAGLADV